VGIYGSEASLEWDGTLIISGGWSKLAVEYACGVKFEVCLYFSTERGKTRLYSSGKREIREPCLRTRCINSISLRLSFYPWMFRDILCWICLRKVKKLTAIVICN